MTKAELVKELRKRTQAGMSECIKALDKSDNDIEKAIVWLRENGAIKAANKQMNAATDGVVLTKQVDNKAVLIEVNCQTDFVARNEQFLEYSNTILDQAIADVTTDGCFEKLVINNKPIAESGLELTAFIGEKIVFRRGKVLVANENQTLGSYTHNNKRVGAIVLVDSKVDPEVVRKVAMHAAAMRPKYLSREQVDPNWLNSEREIIANLVAKEFEEQGKDVKFADKTIEGRLNKILKENCLVDQPFFMDSSKTIGQYLAENKTQPIAFFSFEVGEGIEKAPELSFAEEVAAQMKK